MVKFSNFIIFMSLFYCTLAAGKKDKTINCEEFNESCEKCNTDQPCHFVIWQSKEKKTNQTKCMDVGMNEEQTKKQGPIGNGKDGSHWSMLPIVDDKTKCNNVSYSVDTGKDIKITLQHMLM